MASRRWFRAQVYDDDYRSSIRDMRSDGDGRGPRASWDATVKSLEPQRGGAAAAAGVDRGGPRVADVYRLCYSLAAAAPGRHRPRGFSTVIVSPSTDATRTLVTRGGWFVWGSGRKILTLACFPFASLPRYESSSRRRPASSRCPRRSPTPTFSSISARHDSEDARGLLVEWPLLAETAARHPR